MQPLRIVPENMTQPMGAYSHGYAIDVSPTATLIFLTGQIAIDQNGKVVSPDVATQTRYIFERMKAILSEADASLNDMAKVQIYLTDIADFDIVSPIRNKYLGTSRPASTLVEVSALVREGCKVEVDGIAVKTWS